MNLRELTKTFSNSLPFMDGKTKGETEELYGKIVTIDNIGMMKDSDGKEYVAYTVKEEAEKFYFGGLVLTKDMTQVIENKEALKELEENGLPVLLTLHKATEKGKKDYTKVEYYPLPF